VRPKGQKEETKRMMMTTMKTMKVSKMLRMSTMVRMVSMVMAARGIMIVLKRSKTMMKKRRGMKDEATCTIHYK